MLAWERAGAVEPWNHAWSCGAVDDAGEVGDVGVVGDAGDVGDVGDAGADRDDRADRADRADSTDTAMRVMRVETRGVGLWSCGAVEVCSRDIVKLGGVRVEARRGLGRVRVCVGVRRACSWERLP